MIRTALATTLIAFGLSAATAAPVLRSEVVVTDAIVTVGDMFDDAGEFSEKALFRAPAPGTTGVVDLDSVRKATGIVGLAEFDHRGLAQIRVSRAATIVDELVLTDLILDDLTERGIVTGEIIARARFDQRDLTFNAEAVAEPVRLTAMRYMPGTGAFTAQVTVAGLDKPIDLSGQIELMIETPHLVAPMRAGEIIEAHDIEMRLVPLTQAETFGIIAPEEIIGKALVRRSQGGLMLRPSDVAEPKLVSRNDMVTVYYRKGAMTLTIKGQALGAAAAGEAVDVLNLMTRKVLTGVVTGRGAIDILTTQHVAGL